MPELKEKKITYRRFAEKKAARSPIVKDTVNAFIIGGFICTFGQWFNEFYGLFIPDPALAGTCTSITFIVIASVLTGFGVFDKIARVAGAGTLLPITGFSNAMTSPAIDAKSEGWVLGVGAKMFNVAGPVLLYGTFSAAVYGVIYFVVKTVL